MLKTLNKYNNKMKMNSKMSMNIFDIYMTNKIA